MGRVVRARRVALSQKIIIYLVAINLLLVIAYMMLSTKLPAPATLVAPFLLVIYNVLLSWLVIRRSRRSGDRPMLYTMIFSVLMLGISLLKELLI